MCLVLWVSFYKEILLGYHNRWQWPGIPAILTYSLFWLIHLFSQKAEHWNFRNPNLSHKSFIREGKDIETPFILSATKFLYFFFCCCYFCFVLFYFFVIPIFQSQVFIGAFQCCSTYIFRKITGNGKQKVKSW